MPTDDDVTQLLAAARLQLSGSPALAADRWVTPDPAVMEQLAAARSPLLLAGPGVVRESAVGGLHALAAVGSLGVLNTWGAKGIFHWRSRHHLATVGLQERDFELGGMADADLVITTGVDDDETPPGWRQSAPPVIDLAPGALGPAAELWGRPPVAIPMPPLRSGLAAVTQEGWAVDSVPMWPSRATLHYAEVLGAGGLLAADAGTAGYWVARTFATTELGSVVVPAVARDGLAVACAVASKLRDPVRPVLAVVDGPLSEVSRAVLDAGREMGAGVTVEVWSPDGDRVEPAEHRERLERSVTQGAWSATDVFSLATDEGQMEQMVQVAGAVTAWR